ncbi:STAS domain-containing protein [Streptomyces sp. NPDC058701]|uniref:STAS domain-containing protein n=1 Tax=Streptomyces sp. NPDC058701 TaxID=3346608 RepID=UPI00364D5396
MTSLPPSPLRLTYLDTQDTVHVELRGDLDHHCADVLLDAVTRILAERTRLRDLRLHCAGLTAVDSTGLSTLLMIRRCTGAAGVGLHLDERTARLDRLLRLTGTLDHLIGPVAGGRSGARATDGSPAASRKSTPARSGCPDTGA